MPVIETKGAISSQGFGEFAQSNVSANYIEDVFSTYLYTGTGSTQLIQNNIEIGSAINNGSVFFNGTSATMLTTMPALSGNFTIEFFLYPTDPTRAYLLLDKSFRNTNFSLHTDYLNTGLFYLNVAGVQFNFSFTPPIVNQWSHIAICRSGTDLRFFLNGTQLSTTQTSTGAITTGSLYIGSASTTGSGYSYTQGNISNLRITNTAIYTSNFTTPSSPLTAVTGTQLLTCKAPTYTTDLSTNAYGITATNTANSLLSPAFTQAGAGKGGLVWIKSRSFAADHALYDTARGVTLDLASNTTAAQTTQTTGLTAFNTDGFTIGSLAKVNTASGLFTSWTFREQPKFFDVVTYTGNGVSGRAIPHNLQSVPGVIIIKNLGNTENWGVYHRSVTPASEGNKLLILNDTANFGNNRFGTPTSTNFVVTADGAVNTNGNNYIAYLFAHDAGGFGANGADNVISCGGYTGTGAFGNVVTIGYEPQWILVKSTSSLQNWVVWDSVRGMASATSYYLYPNATTAEVQDSNTIIPRATGFEFTNGDPRWNNAGELYVYITIRRGPMKTPTTGTSVFQPVVYTGTNVDNRLVTTNLITDFIMARQRNSTTLGGMLIGDRLRGNQYWLTGNSAIGVTDPDSLMTPTLSYGNSFSAMNGFGVGNDVTSQLNASTVANNQVVEAFARAPGFLDVVTYTGTGSARTVNHNLGVKPEMIWVKRLDVGSATAVVYTSTVGATGYLSQTGAIAAQYGATMFNNTEPTSTQFTVATASNVNTGGNSYAAYLMASVPGVSKCSYYVGRGVGTSQQVDCGFASGVRFVLIKTVGAAGPWYVWDSARGIVAGNDPYVLLDSSAAEVTTTDYIDTYSAGFEVSTTAPIDINPGYGEVINSQAAVDGTSTMNDIVYGGGLWVVVSQAGNVSRSITGYSWTTVTGVMSIATGVTFGNGLYVVVGSSGAIATSPDAITWTARTSGVTNALNSAAYAFGKYWVVGNGGTVLSSTNGIAWSSVSSGTTEALDRIRFLNNNLVIVGTNGTIVTSSDGITFTVRTSGTTSNLRGVAFGAGLYVVTGASNTVRTSPDLVTWTARTGPTGTLNNIVWASYRFVVQSGSPGIWYSADGITWTAGVSSGIGTFGYQGMWFANDLVMSGNSDGDIYISDPRMWYWAIA